MPASVVSRRNLLAGRPLPPAGVVIGDACLAAAGIVCYTCREACPENAIRLELALGTAPQPIVDARRCTGCNACIDVCPSGAIVAGGDGRG